MLHGRLVDPIYGRSVVVLRTVVPYIIALAAECFSCIGTSYIDQQGQSIIIHYIIADIVVVVAFVIVSQLWQQQRPSVLPCLSRAIIAYISSIHDGREAWCELFLTCSE